MKCRLVQSRLSAYQDGELNADDSAAIESHLAGCPACRLEWLSLQGIKARLQAAPEPQAPPWMAARVMSRLAAAESAARRPVRAPRPALAPIASFALIVILAASFLSGFLIGWPPRAKAAPAPAVDLMTLWEQNRSLNLLSVQESTLALLRQGGADEE